LFGFLCGAVTVATVGLSMSYGAADLGMRMFGARVAHAGVIFAGTLNLHFAMAYARIARAHQVAFLLYLFVGFYQTVNWGGWWWAEGSFGVKQSVMLGYTIAHNTFTLTTFGRGFYIVGSAQYAASIVLLFLAYRSGRREALTALAGAALLGVAILNDIGLITGWLGNTVYLLPHVFVVYGFGVATTLLLRYRFAAGQLEQTVSNLQLRTEELRRSNAELSVVQDELVRKQQLAAVGELAAAIAHEVRNPLAVIVNAVSGLRRRGLKAEDRQMLLNIVDEETARLNRLVTDLLRFARPVRVNRSQVSLVELCSRARSVVDDDYEVQFDIPEDPSIQNVWVDPGLFRLVFDNLLANAAQAMKYAGPVRVVVGQEMQEGVPMVRIDVIDEGHGMESDVLERAKDPFFTTRPSGTGLGLPIVQRIMAAHGGELRLSSEQGKGTTASLLIPKGEPALTVKPHGDSFERTA
jgi:signal transduction histidine kinase